MLNEDVQYWSDYKDRVKKKADRQKEQLNVLIAKQKRQLASCADDATQEVAAERRKALLEAKLAEVVKKAIPLQIAAPITQPTVVKYALKKLPMWGYHAETHEIEFEWPSNLDQIHPDVSLKAIRFKCCGAQISSVQCTLSNSQQSPVFENAHSPHQSPQTIHIEASAVKAVRAREYVHATNGCLWRMSFMDIKSYELCTYNPRHYGDEQKEHKLGENEEIIGVYGIPGKKYNCFLSLGFIVRVKTHVYEFLDK